MSKFLLLLLLFISVSEFGCIPEEEVDPIDLEPEFINSYQPSDNQLVDAEKVLGSSTAYSSLFYSEKSENGGFYVVGELDGDQSSAGQNVGGADFEEYFEPALIRFDAQGNVLWEKRPGFTIQGFTVVPAGVLTSKEIIVLTGHDDNEEDYEDESPDRSRIMIFDEDGLFLDNYSRDFTLNLFDVKVKEVTSDYVQFIGVGSVRKITVDGNHYPGFFEFRVNKSPLEIDTTIGFDTDQLIEEQFKHLRFRNLEIIGDTYVVSGNRYEDGDYLDVHLLQFSNDNYDQPLWWNSLSNGGEEIFHWQGGLHIADQKAFVSGYFEDETKGHWVEGSSNHEASGYIGAFSLLNGNQIWVKELAESAFSDRLFETKFYNGDLIASGVSARTYCPECTEKITVGNGWLLKLDANTGAFKSSKTIGDISFRTRLRTLVLEADKLWCIGKQQYTTKLSYGLVISINPDSI